MSPRTSRASLPVLLCVLGVCGVTGARGMIFYDTGDPAHNREVAPGGAWAGSGWQWQGYYKNFLGTKISPRHFVTSKHVGTNGTTFVAKSFFTGGGSDVVYQINPNVNGGTGYWNISGTDLRVFEVYGEFPGHAPLYTGTDEAGKELVVFGRGRPRGAEEQLLGQTRGWRWASHDRRPRWGVNDVDYILDAGGSTGELLVFDFDPVVGQEECHLTDGDSGGGVFVKDGPDWKLAGINYAVDGRYDTNNTCNDGTDFIGAMFDTSGYFIGQDNANCTGWQPTSVATDTIESRAYSVRISAYAGTLQTIIQPAIDAAALTPLERYEDWIAGFGVVGEGLPEENADGDSWRNLVEYFGATDPTVVGGPDIFRVYPENGMIRFEVRERLDFESLGLAWEITGATGGSFGAVAGLSEVSATISRAEGVTTRVLEIPMPADPATIYRLEVTVNP